MTVCDVAHSPPVPLHRDTPLHGLPEMAVFDGFTGALIMKLQPFHEKRVVAVAFDPSGTRVVSVGADAKHRYVQDVTVCERARVRVPV